MFASRGFRLSALFVVLLTMFSVVAVDTAEARRGGSFGSRGTRTYQTVPATPTSPTVTAPVNRSMTSPTTTNRGDIASTTPAQRAGWFGGGIGGWIIGGLLFSGLFGLMFGAGFGGFGGFVALLFQVIIIGLLLSWLFGRRRQPAQAMLRPTRRARIGNPPVARRALARTPRPPRSAPAGVTKSEFPTATSTRSSSGWVSCRPLMPARITRACAVLRRPR